MIAFHSDYAEGAHEKILEELLRTNMVQTPGYGEDEYCLEAAGMIQDICECPEAAVHFLVGGTQANLTVISSFLRPHQGVISAECGHISVHETGAIEATGHKVLTLKSADGKIDAGQIRQLYTAHIQDDSYEHMVQPKMVYISNPTEYGMLYSKEELTRISEVCREYGLYLYMDGARLGYGLTVENNSLGLKEIAALCDAFTIGGTKCGALFGEAVVISNPALQEDFRYLMKQKGGMLAKGRLLGIQFKALFRDGLYFHICRHANRLAMIMRGGFLEKGWEMYVNSDTNQQFVIVPDTVIARISEKYTFSCFAKLEGSRSVLRFCTSWATREKDVLEFLEDLRAW